MPQTLGPLFNRQNGKVREWSISVALFTEAGHEIPLSQVECAKIKKRYYTSYTTCSGCSGMKMTTSAPTVVRMGKNLGRKDETNVLTQANKESQSRHAAKIMAGYVLRAAGTSESGTRQANAMPFPMALKSWKGHKAKLEYPLYIQPKLDGVRMLAKYEDGEVALYTRRLHAITGFTRVRQDLKHMFQAVGFGSFIIDGELYSHGTDLQTISGIVRNESIPETEKEKLLYHVFDFFDPANATIGFKNRFTILRNFVKSTKSELVVLNDTFHVENSKEADRYFKKTTAAGYEGLIFKSADHPYEFDFNKEKRSSWYLKRKKQEDCEFPIVGFTNGRGKDVDCIVFVLEANGKRFNCVPNGTYEYRKQLYEAARILSTPSLTITQIGRDLSFD
ncbi:hypothetical protein FI667_g2582, partial [Globisporangium splendens]